MTYAPYSKLALQRSQTIGEYPGEVTSLGE